MAPNFLSIMWHWQACYRLGVHDVKSLILVGALFLLDGGKRREGKKKEIKEKITMGEEGFPGAGPA
jgi:hypothetical protein